MSTQRLKVNEIFFSIQGESSHIGRPCVMVRLTGCQMRCTWCDTEYSFYEGEWLQLDEIVAKVKAYGCELVEVTGGEPLLQPAVHPLLERLADEGLEVLLETGGGLDIGSVDERVRRIVDIKCPGSGESANNHWPNLDELTPRDEVKFVLKDRADYEWAVAVVEEHALTKRCPVLLSPVWESLEPRLLAEWVLEEKLDLRVQVQLHKVLWGAETRGV